MTYRPGERDSRVSPLTARWDRINPLTVARDRGREGATIPVGYLYSQRTSGMGLSRGHMSVQPPAVGSATLGTVEVLGDTNLLTRQPALAPMVPGLVSPMKKPMSAPLVRKMGESVLTQRGRGNTQLWSGTPAMQSVSSAAVLGDPEIDLTEYFQGWQRVGWEWDLTANQLKAYFTRDGQDYVVKMPMSYVRKVFNQFLSRPYFKARAMRGLFGEMRTFKNQLVRRPEGQERLDGFFKKVGNWFKKVGKKIVKGVTKVVSSPIFGAIASVAAAIPPLSVVGGPALAAHAGVKAAKPFIDAGLKGLDKVEKVVKGAKAAIKKGKKPSPFQAVALAAKSGDKKALQAAIKKLPQGELFKMQAFLGATPKGKLGSLMKAAQKSKQTTKKGAKSRVKNRNVALRFARGRLTRVASGSIARPTAMTRAQRLARLRQSAQTKAEAANRRKALRIAKMASQKALAAQGLSRYSHLV